ncbi:MAG: lipoyl(octanoyl) transferase LipB [Pacificimonas sp.]|nr:lipoyl(octanoyl) transferase LipB [Pacificimonas sp.]
MAAIKWQVSEDLTPYPDAVASMENRATAVFHGSAPERIWLVEHPPLYTAGTSAKADDLLDPRFPVFNSGRGGEYTYHGPGQRVVYPAVDLRVRGRDVRAYVQTLEQWIIAALAEFGISGEVRCGRIGVWVATPAGEAKIAAIGVRIRRWITLHGLSINVDPDLDHFGGIVPCGLPYPVTSLAALGAQATMADVDAALRKTCPFAPVY